ncbi:hypothetical protein BC833DRAFT_571588 [Globomyces pollinis-pini]|nr:hypothetical protein BC833DRAFT_571588 [Globomyces pollinis-pini]
MTHDFSYPKGTRHHKNSIRKEEFDLKTALKPEPVSTNLITFYQKHGFYDIMPSILNFASMTDLFPNKLRLKSNTNSNVELSRLQIACLISNIFLCQFLNPAHRIFKENPTNNVSKLQFEKMKFFKRYFEMLTKESFLEGSVKFHRVSVAHCPDWSSLKDKKIGPVTICLNEKIEDQNAAQLDFCNRRIGGGVLNHGAVQEEIMFLCRPECIASMLFTDPLDNNESLIIEGANIFSGYSGYRSALECQPLSKSMSNVSPTIIAIDALRFKEINSLYEFQITSIQRELNKAFAGFSMATTFNAFGNKEIATGHWGCGAFNGNKELKSIIQLLVASACDSSLIYCCFGEQKFYESFGRVHRRLTSKNVTIADLFHWTVKYVPKKVNHKSQTKALTLFDHIHTQITTVYGR